MMIFTLFLILVVQQTYSYLDIGLNVHRQQNYISYTVPFTINKNMQYALATTFQQKSQFIMSLSKKLAAQKKNKKHKSVSISVSGPLTGFIKASSLEGYSFQGWKRFFMEALLYIDSRYYHQITVNFDNIVHKKQNDQFNRDGVISFGPNLVENKIYQMIKTGSDFVKNDIVSIYRGVNDKNIRMQLGGFQQSYARGHKNGILFYQMQINAEDGKWWVPIKSLVCVRQRNGKTDNFYITNSQLNLSLSIQSPFLKLPMNFASDLERNFEAVHTSCKITQDNRLACSNMTSIDLSLNFVNLQIDNGASINISLYDLKDNYDEKTGQTIFYIQFVNDLKQLQIGQALFKSYYVSVDMGNKKMLFSPINRFPSDNYGVYVVRFFVAFGIFTVVSAIGAMIWQTFNDPFKKNKLMYGQDGIRLVSYQRPNESNQID